MKTKKKVNNPVSEDAIMEVIEGWRDEETKLRNEANDCAFPVPRHRMKCEADQLAKCRHKLAIATGLDADPGKEQA